LLGSVLWLAVYAHKIGLEIKWRAGIFIAKNCTRLLEQSFCASILTTHISPHRESRSSPSHYQIGDLFQDQWIRFFNVACWFGRLEAHNPLSMAQKAFRSTPEIFDFLFFQDAWRKD
jgi:hypothetical protein